MAPVIVVCFMFSLSLVASVIPRPPTYRCIARAERDGTRAETRFRHSPKRTRPFKSVGASVQSTAGSRGVRISFSDAGYTTFGGGVRVLATHSIRQFPPSFPLPCVTVCHQVPNELYFISRTSQHICLARTLCCTIWILSPDLGQVVCGEGIWKPCTDCIFVWNATGPAPLLKYKRLTFVGGLNYLAN